MRLTMTELQVINRIADRAVSLFSTYNIAADGHKVAIVVGCVHKDICPLQLEELLVAEDFDFVHDIVGMLKHYDWATNRLTNCFIPRYAK